MQPDKFTFPNWKEKMQSNPKMSSFVCLNENSSYMAPGMIWYRSVGDHKYFVIRVRYDYACEDHLCSATGYVVDLSPESELWHHISEIVGSCDLKLNENPNELQLIRDLVLSASNFNLRPVIEIQGDIPEKLLAIVKNHPVWLQQGSRVGDIPVVDIEIIPRMDNFEYLSGDVNWRRYGCNWYRSLGDHKYQIIRSVCNHTSNLTQVCPFSVYGYQIDLDPCGESVFLLDGALGHPMDVLALLDHAVTCLPGVPMIEASGDDPDALFMWAKNHPAWVRGHSSVDVSEISDPVADLESIPKMDSFEYLSGEVNWRERGCNWYRSRGAHMYDIIELICSPSDDVVALSPWCSADCYVIDLSPDGMQRGQVSDMLAEMDMDLGVVRDELDLVWSLVAWYDHKMFQIVGDDAEEVLNQAKAHPAWEKWDSQ